MVTESERSMEAGDHARLLALLTAFSYAKRKVVLSSGRESDFYIDCKQTLLRAEGHALVGRVVLAMIRAQLPDVVAVGGMTMGADPIVSAVSTVSYLQRVPLDGFYVRQQPKGHGTGRWLEGVEHLAPGARVAMVEDVVTTGASTLRAIERTRAFGLTVAGVVAVVDRCEGGREAICPQVPMWSVYTRDDFSES